MLKQVLKSNDIYETNPPIEHGAIIITDDREKAECFNNYFAKASEIDESQISWPNSM